MGARFRVVLYAAQEPLLPLERNRINDDVDECKKKYCNSITGQPVLVARGKSILIIWTPKSDFPTFKAGRIKASAMQ